MNTSPGHERHLNMIMEHRERLTTTVLVSFVAYAIGYFAVFFILEIFTKMAVQANPKSTWKNYTDLDK